MDILSPFELCILDEPRPLVDRRTKYLLLKLFELDVLAGTLFDSLESLKTFRNV